MLHSTLVVACTNDDPIQRRGLPEKRNSSVEPRWPENAKRSESFNSLGFNQKVHRLFSPIAVNGRLPSLCRMLP